MDKTLKGIFDFNQYVFVTHKLASKPDAPKGHLNLASVLALKKIQTFEIEFFCKYEKTGVAVAVFEDFLLSAPPSKTWGLLGKELIFILQFWLDAIRKQLLRDSRSWFKFLQTLLRFIVMLKQKHNSFPDMLVQETAEILLDLATNPKVDLFQKFEIVHCFNQYCAESSREIRVGNKAAIDRYLSKLSTIMSSCGHFPTQHCILEALLRWTIGRQDPVVRKRAAEKWLPTNLFDTKVIQIFLERKWIDFFQDARDFLNIHNNETAAVTSVVCKKLVIGNTFIFISGSEEKDFWLDFNSTSKCLTLLLDPRYLPKLLINSNSWYETLTVNENDVTDLRLERKCQDAIIKLSINKSIYLQPSMKKMTNTADTMDITVAVTDNFDRLDAALRFIFGEVKYKLLPPVSTAQSDNEMSVAPELRLRRRRSGYIVRPRYDPLKSPSTTSTTSLAQLPQKLAALPAYRFDKEPVSVCAQPELSNVTELTEPDDRSSANTTTNIRIGRRCGVFSKTYKEGRSQSDSELKKPNKNAKKGACISPVYHDENSISLLVVATIGSDESVINETIKRLPKEKDCTADNIIDLLAREALQATTKDAYIESAINLEVEKTHNTYEINSDVVENTPCFEINLKPSETLKSKDKNYKRKKSTSNESNTEDLNEETEIPINYVSTRNRKPRRNTVDADENAFDNETVENFFSQHFSVNPVGELTISPTLARKINESSSDNSVDFDENFLQMNDNDAAVIFNEEDVFNCLNDLIDKVCDNLQNYTQSHSSKISKKEIATMDKENDIPTTEQVFPNNKTSHIIKEADAVKRKQPAKNNSIKLKYVVGPKIERKTKSRGKKNTTKPKIVPKTKMSTIKEADDEVIEKEPSLPPESPSKTKQDSSPKRTSSDSDTALIRRKRKLYSPKGDEENIGTEVKMPKITIPETCEEIDTNVTCLKPARKETLKSVATPYKDLMKERKRLRKPRNRKSSVTLLSPRTRERNAIFDQMKNKIESNESIRLVEKNKENVYNFTSDSEDEDFVKKKSVIQKRVSATTISSFDSNNSTKRGRKVTKVNYTESKSDSAAENNPVQKPRRKRSKRQNPRKVKVAEIISKGLVDEKMRAPPEALNTSVIENTADENLVTELEPIISVVPEMEMIADTDKEKPSVDASVKKSKRILSIKKEVGRKLSRNKEKTTTSNEESESPLPGLVVETLPQTVDVADGDRSISPNLINKMKKIYKEANTDQNNTNTTQKLLSDVETMNCSPELNITEEVNRGIADIIEIEDLTNSPSSNKNKSTSKRNYLSLQKNIGGTKIIEIRNSIETVDLNVDDVEDKSIDTNGLSPITAHGDSNENPPSPTLLNKTVIPRNLEVETLDASTAKYFLKLTREANESGDNFYSCDERSTKSTNKIPTDNSNNTKDTLSTNKSPLVSLTRLSCSDFQKWLPSPRSTDSEEDTTPREVSKSRYAAVKKDNNNKESDKSKSRYASTAEKRRRNVLKQDSIKRSKVKDNVSEQEDKHNEYFDNLNKTSTTIRKSARSTMISPITLTFDNSPCKNLRASKSNSQSPVQQLTSKRRSDSKTSNTEKSSLYNLRNSTKLQSSPISRGNSSVESVVYVKKTTPVTKCSNKVEAHKLFNVENEELCASKPSVSSVNEWFKSMSYPHHEQGASSPNIELIDTVMEKLDTTLAEIHKSTSKKFIGLFINTQQQLQQQRNERHKLYKKEAKLMLENMVKVMDQTFAQLEKGVHQMELQFMENLKEQSCSLVRGDTMQKRAMVVLLKEDLQAVVDYTAKTKRD